MNDVVSDRLEGEINDKAWPTRRLSAVCEINPRHSGELGDEKNVTFVPMAAVDEQVGAITAPETRAYGEVRTGYTHFEENDVLFAKITPCRENGKAAIARDLTNGLGCGSTEFFVLRSKGDVLPEYIYYLVRHAA